MSTVSVWYARLCASRVFSGLGHSSCGTYRPSVPSNTPLHCSTSTPAIASPARGLHQKYLLASCTGRCTSKYDSASPVALRLEQLDRHVYVVRHGQHNAVCRLLRVVRDERPAALLRILKGERHNVRDALQRVNRLRVDGGYRLDSGTTCGP
ncbi:hypothetical protein DFH11DRAFT_1193458 [Phellopilus nigrolimitatus]|nr:hypothetical protein DFH11DRAFT_1193458 [Phellopilus nigrolimitatus]